MRKLLLILFLPTFALCLMTPQSAAGSCPDLDKAPLDNILVILGMTDPEELDEDTIERFAALLRRPLKINIANREQLASSGLFSQYQIASLEDYRAKAGDVLSVMELATIDGFGRILAEALQNYVSFESLTAPGEVSGKRKLVDNTLQLRWQYGNGSLGARYRLSVDDRGDCALAWRKAGDVKTLTMYGQYYSRKSDAKLIFGDFNARFGQGLSLWTGFSLNSLQGVRSFYKRPSGISSSWSFSPSSSLRGIAGSVSGKRYAFSAIMGIPDLRQWMERRNVTVSRFLPGANYSRYWNNGQAGVTAWAMTDKGSLASCKVSSDMRLCINGIQLFGEVSYDAVGRSLAALGGGVFPLGDRTLLAAAVRYYPASYDPSFAGAMRGRTRCKDETGVAIGLQRDGLTVSCDMYSILSENKNVAKLLVNNEFSIGSKVSVKLRLSQRLRNYSVRSRTDLRGVVQYSHGLMSTVVRGDCIMSSSLVKSEKPSWGLFAYVEEGLRKESLLNAFLRISVFRADSWEDRIYVYERDAPGAFLVPAYYGRGYAASAYVSKTFRIGKRLFGPSLKLYARGSAIRYPFMAEPKKSQYDLRLQAVFDF